MFTAKGLFSEVVCPFQETCILPRCMFKHSSPIKTAAETLVTSNDQTIAGHDQNGQRKRQKLDDENRSAPKTAGLGSGQVDKEKTQTSALQSKANEKPREQSYPATREISPPPLKRKIENGTSTPAKTSPSSMATPKAVAKTTAKTPLKKEGLNPRVLKCKAPAGHDMRFKLLKALHTEFHRLNSELAKDANDAEEELVLSEQALITRALDFEEDAAASAAVYSNLVKNKILIYKRMKVLQWVEERKKEIAQEKAKQAALMSDTPVSKPAGPPKEIETGLNIDEELALLHRLYTPISDLAQHGYVVSIPTEKEIETAKQGVEAAHGWENCDRCKSRFQVFPGRREEDGALASGGKCTYHFGKPYWQERSATDPKAKREKKFRCCGESLGESTGCTTSENHVFKISEVKRLAAILNFEKTPENPEKFSDRPVCIDGEMCYTVYGLELVRLTATSWPTGSLLFDVLVRPIGPILDLNSRYSGVWPKDLAEALPWSADSPSHPAALDPEAKSALRIVDSPAAARAILFSYLSPDTPLIGHGLENDLNASRIIHPTIIDTALLYPHKAGLPYRNGLKMLMQTHLNRHIQVVVDGKMDGHDSKEDANAAGDLTRFALANEWKKMKGEGWRVQDGEFRPPTPREGLNVPTGSKVGLTVWELEREEPIRILTNGGAGRKREREEMEKIEMD
ncbi:uncharacterized protein L3040_006965 [Drepanopeziza brunnea f. sp. 'multigermtubi']|uniref:Exonuclease n=1 Tax=Marssonina brunnea f. sp. multigermtubi (strain MB_m1) TaxID=1072389 RepID=K1WIY1_MARBU|nr:exonuclease [Drepanopeziza brunnea f. sp. 'multigermtubi' MB_m1]EKD12811.1 exonuclease [Drepanopeziza brunnea f. sp. 'multigermtubi' MB_m1]KAJ5038094.1 hypothetical protein L3040_006965 [Drepanopeziza brunnea f. sp. 'multigermtubi']